MLLIQLHVDRHHGRQVAEGAFMKAMETRYMRRAPRSYLWVFTFQAWLHVVVLNKFLGLVPDDLGDIVAIGHHKPRNL